MSSPDRVTYTPHSDTSPELEAAALAAAYRYILDCHAKKAAEAGGGEDGIEGGDEQGPNDAGTNIGQLQDKYLTGKDR